MTRRSRKQGRSRAARTQAAVAQMQLVGAALVMVPWWFDKPPFSAMAAGLRPVGGLLLAAGAIMGLVLWWLQRPSRPPWPRQGQVMPASQQAPGERRAGARGSVRAAEPVVPAEPAQSPGPALRSFVQAEPLAPPVASPPVPPDAWSRAVFDRIEWRRFEAVVEALFRQAGFITEAKPHGADGGVDVWLYSRSTPGRAVGIVQCKHWQGKKVGVDKVRELRGVMAAHDVRRGQFATTSSFTPDAIEFARANGIHLLDIDALLALIAQRSAEQQQALLAVALEGEYWRPTCVNCGIKLVERGGERGRFWGCPAFPRCRTTMPMRAV